MAATNQITGKFFVRVNGNLLPLSGDASVDPGGAKREAVVLNDGAVKYRESLESAKVECTVIDDGSIGAKDIQAITGATIIVESDAGRRWTINNAFCTDIPKINSKGEIEAKFEGDEAEEVKS